MHLIEERLRTLKAIAREGEKKAQACGIPEAGIPDIMDEARQ